jgi:IPP transferase
LSRESNLKLASYSATPTSTFPLGAMSNALSTLDAKQLTRPRGDAKKIERHVDALLYHLFDRLFFPVCLQISEIDSKQKLAIVVGGTNYYIESLLWKVLVQYDCSAAAPAAALNSVAADKSATLELAKLPNDELMRRLEAADPDTALRLHPNDRRKLLR